MFINKILFVFITFYLLSCFSTALFASDKSEKTRNEQQLKSVVPNEKINDGPYVFWEAEDKLSAIWFCDNVIEKQTFSMQGDKIDLFNQCNLPVRLDRFSFIETTILEYQGDFKVAASSDFHGQYDLMFELLKNNQIITDAGDWDFGNGHFVITGDVFDRGDKVTEILWFLYRLEKQAEQAGGKLHLLLGNHEVMVLNGDLRYLHPKYIEVAKRVNQSFEMLYGKGTILGDWLRSKPVLIKVNDMLFAHGGFHPSLAREKRSLEQINHTFKQNLVKAELTEARADWGKYLHKSNGPIWYRGYFKDEGASSAEIDLLLSHFKVRYLVVGHTSQKNILTKHQGRVIAIDSSIKGGQYGELLLVDGNNKWRATLNGDNILLQ